MSEVWVLYNDGKLRAVYAEQEYAVRDLRLMLERGYKNVRVQEVQLQYQSREADPIDDETREGLQRMVERI